MPLYNLISGGFLGLNERSVFIMVRGDKDETFFSCGYNGNKSKVLCSVSKQIMPQVFQGTPFKKDVSQILNERSREDFSRMFFYLPNTTDRKRKSTNS